MRPERRPTTGVPKTAELAGTLEEGLCALGLDLAADTRQRLLDYLAMMVRWNAVYNLTAIRDTREMLTHHLLDSLAIVTPLRAALDLDHAHIADIGSGAGLPGIPLAIVCPEARFVSVEPVGKKAAFQRQVAAELSLTNLEVVNVRVETLERPVDLVTCRAFASLADFLSLANGLIGPDTWVAAMKGQRAEIDAELKEIDPASPATVLPLQVPFIDAQRHLVLLPSVRARMAA